MIDQWAHHHGHTILLVLIALIGFMLGDGLIRIWRRRRKRP